MTIKPVSSTMGKSSPATVSVDAGGGGYRWRKIPDWEPGDPRYREHGQGEPLPQNRIATAAKRKRVAEYTRLRLEGKTKEEAAAEIGISASTMGYYERAFKSEHPEAAS